MVGDVNAVVGGAAVCRCGVRSSLEGASQSGVDWWVGCR